MRNCNFILLMFVFCSWLDVVDFHYSVKIAGLNPHFVKPHVQAVEQLQTPPPNWTFEHDEKLAHFLHGNKRFEQSRLGSIQNYVHFIIVSSFDVSLMLIVNYYNILIEVNMIEIQIFFNYMRAINVLL